MSHTTETASAVKSLDHPLAPAVPIGRVADSQQLTQPAARFRGPRRSGFRLWVAGIIAVASIALGLFTAPAAGASAPVAGVTFTSTVTCSTSVDELRVMASSNYPANSMAMISLYDYRTGRWMNEANWHDVSRFNRLIAGSFNFVGHGRYAVRMQYAQYTTQGWKYNHEDIRVYYQRNANGYGTYASGTCYV